MIKPEWGTKRTCPQTGVRFYDLGNDNPVTSPNGYQWHPEAVLKSKQPLAFEQVKPEKKDDDLEGSDDLELADADEGEASADDDVDLGGDDDLGVETGGNEDEQ